MNDKRKYKKLVPEYADLMEAEDWLLQKELGFFVNFDGNGYWVRNGMQSNDEVFSSEQEDATHVAWYNK